MEKDQKRQLAGFLLMYSDLAIETAEALGFREIGIEMMRPAFRHFEKDLAEALRTPTLILGEVGHG